ncbi:MAG: enoyl-CoA hydratase-related protein [Chloroflexi bacterium]|nr:enoyl-CoA hydratase-related protein [Chloroflexota bacterium]
MEYKYLKYEVASGILTLTLNQPEKMNAQGAASCRELASAFEAADRDEDVRVVIVTGAGRAFSAGADLTINEGVDNYFFDRMQGREDTEQHRDEGGVVSLIIYDMKKPVIAAINGAAVGFGITMTLPMDIRLASKNSKMGFVFARRGILFDGCASWFLPRLVGMDVAADWVYSGRIISAQEAYDKRLVSELLDADDLMPRARHIAREMIDNSSAVSIALCRQLMWKMLGAGHPMDAHILESRALNWAFGMPDAKEGIMSFLEKRLPNFPMRTNTDMPGFYPWWEQQEFKYK